uniref:Heat shock protein 70 n=1 Tax=Zeugodacus cucurbitae TaxID=28588 RepID=A0A0A1WEF8_ZEUCU
MNKSKTIMAETENEPLDITLFMNDILKDEAALDLIKFCEGIEHTSSSRALNLPTEAESKHLKCQGEFEINSDTSLAQTQLISELQTYTSNQNTNRNTPQLPMVSQTETEWTKYPNCRAPYQQAEGWNTYSHNSLVVNSQIQGELVAHMHGNSTSTALNEILILKILGPYGTAVLQTDFDKIVERRLFTFTRKLLYLVFDRETLATHTVRGSKWERRISSEKHSVKFQLDPRTVFDVTYCLQNLFNCPKEKITRAITWACKSVAARRS